jgi:hypothetical protein
VEPIDQNSLTCITNQGIQLYNYVSRQEDKQQHAELNTGNKEREKRKILNEIRKRYNFYIKVC